MSLISAKEAAETLLRADNILIITHRRPDGDTLGSAAGLCEGLRHIGKTAYVFDNPETTERYVKYVAPYTAPEGFRPDFTVSVDVASEDLVPEGVELPVDLVVDHHQGEPDFARNAYVENAAACGEMVYGLLGLMNVGVDARIALPLYVSICTDTGCFAYSNTSSGTHRIAAKLFETGIDAFSVNYEIFILKSRKRILIEKSIMDSMEFYYDGRVAVAVVTSDFIESIGAEEDDLENISSITRQIEGVDIGIMIREQKDQCKVSVRTSGNADASVICGGFGGGGHRRAAGCTVRGTAYEARGRLIEVAGKNLAAL